MTTKLRRISILFFLLLAGLLSAQAYAQPQAGDTVLFANVKGQLCQMVHVTGITGPVDRWAIAVGSAVTPVDPKNVQAYKGGWLVPIPAVESPTELSITAGEAGSITHTVKPQKRWTAYLTSHTHFDLGFTDVQTRVWNLQMRYLEEAMNVCEETGDWPEESRYRWTIECSSLLEKFAERHADKMPRLLKLIQEGQVDVTGEYIGLLTELCGGEELCRSFYPLAKFRDKYGITATTAMHNDIPGITWQMPQLFQGAGIRYLALRANPVRAKFLWERPDAPTRPFLWEGPDGSSIMVWYTDSYREANFFRGDCSPKALEEFFRGQDGHPYDQFLGIIARQEAKGTPVDAIQMRMGGDNMGPTINPCLWARAWNERWAYPRILVGTNRMFFEHIERFRPQLEKHRGDITDWWADGAGSSARETGMNRVSHERTAVAETLGALVDKGVLGDTWDVYREMLLYDEHTFGSSGSIRTRDPANAAEQWKIKSGFTYNADRMSRKLMEKARDSLAEAVRSDKVTRLVVWNPSSWPRSGIVEVKLPEYRAVYDPDSRRPLQAQRVGDRWALRVENIPPLGWKAFEIWPGEFPTETALRKPASPSINVSYIYDAGGKREKILPYYGFPTYEKNRSKTEIEYSKSLSVRGGLLAQSSGRLENPPGSKSLQLTATSYAGSNRLDIAVDIDKVATEDMEGVYLEFPFDLDKPTARVGIPFAWMDAAKDRLPCTCADFFSIDRAVDINDGRRGVMFAAVEAPLVEFGKITTDAWSENLAVEKGNIYSYVMNNYWFTNYKFSQGGPHTFRYAIKPYKGAFDAIAASRFGEEAARPLEARIVWPGGAGRWAKVKSWSAMRIQPDNVIVAAVKPAEDGRGIIIRLAESAGRDAEVCLSAKGLPAGTLWRCTLLEDDVERIGPSDGSARFHLSRWQIATIRLVPEGT